MNKTNRIKQIEAENFIWIIYIIIIGLSYYGNYYEKNYFETNNTYSKEKYRKINAYVFTILIVIYLYFEKEAIESFSNKNNKTKKQKEYDTLILFATTAILISGIIFLYIIIDDNNLDTEIAFN